LYYILAQDKAKKENANEPIFKKYFELLFWLAVIILFAFFTNPGSTAHFSLCAFKTLGFDACIYKNKS
jgi:hypothetical protein